MEKNSKIIVFGAGGLIGSEIVNLLKIQDYSNVIACTHNELDLENQAAVKAYFCSHKPNYIFFCAVKSITNFDTEKCIDAAEMYSNIIMQLNVMEAARINNVHKAIFLGSAMLYPWNDEHENELLQEKYIEDFRIMQYRDSMKSTVLSKFVSMKLCQYYYKQYGCKYIYAIPTHIYGNFKERKNLYFLETMVQDLCDAKLSGKKEIFIDIFGEGKARKQILHVKDCAEAIILSLDKYEDFWEPINIGSEKPETWSSIVKIICQLIGYDGKVIFNSERKENLSNRICSINKIKNLGWTQKISMEDGLRDLCKEYINTKKESM